MMALICKTIYKHTIMNMASIDNLWVEIIRRPAVEWIKGLNGCHDTLICESRSFKYKDGTKNYLYLMMEVVHFSLMSQLRS